MSGRKKPQKQKKSSIHKRRNIEEAAATTNEEEITNQKNDPGGQNVDRLSALPDAIIHQILMSLPLPDALNTKSLSRQWRHSIWPSSSILYFDEYFFGANFFQYLRKDRGKRKKFAKFLLKSLQKQQEMCANNCTIDKFGIRAASKNKISSFAIDCLVKLALKNNVKEMDLRIKRIHCDSFKRFWLPDSVFASKSLVSLSLEYVNIGLDFTFDLPSLKKLTLSESKLLHDGFRRLIQGCPLLEDLCVEFCKGVESIEVSVPNLKSLKLNFSDIYEVAIQSPSLQSVEFSGSDFPEDNFDLNTRRLKGMVLKNLFISDYYLKNLLDGCPLLESLIIDGCQGFERIRVRPNVRKLSMLRCRGIMEAEVLSLNLESLEYSGDMMVSFSFCRLEYLRLVEVKISVDPTELDADWYIRLRNLLKGLEKCKVLTLVCHSDQAINFPGELSDDLLPSLRGLKHLKLEISSLTTTCPAIVDGLIWIFPSLETITVKSGSINKLIKPQRRRRWRW